MNVSRESCPNAFVERGQVNTQDGALFSPVIYEDLQHKQHTIWMQHIVSVEIRNADKEVLVCEAMFNVIKAFVNMVRPKS